MVYGNTKVSRKILEERQLEGKQSRITRTKTHCIRQHLDRYSMKVDDMGGE